MTRETIAAIRATLDQQYRDHEITSDQFVALSEDIALVERRNHA